MAECKVCQGLGYIESVNSQFHYDDDESDLGEYETCLVCMGTGEARKRRRPKKQRWDDGSEV